MSLAQDGPETGAIALWATLGEDQRARLIWDRPALVLVKCPKERCILGKVALTPDGHRLAVPPFKIRTEDWYEGRPVDPDGKPATRPWVTFPVADAGNIPVRCHHHTWSIGGRSLLDAVSLAQRSGKPVVVFASWVGLAGWAEAQRAASHQGG